MRELPLETPLYEALGARAPLLRPLEKMGIKTVRDLLWHFPVRYEDFSKIYAIAELEPGQQATIQAAIEDVRIRRTRRGFTIIEAVLADESGSLRAVWFNQPYITNVLRAGRIANFSGKVSISDENDLYLSGPAYEVLKAATAESRPETTHTARLVPVYPETKGITSRGIRFLTQRILKQGPAVDEWLPASVLHETKLPTLKSAIEAIHFPKKIESALAAQKRFSFEDLFLLQIWNLEQKLKLSEKEAPAIPTNIDRVKAILEGLPFTLTQSQKQSFWEIIQDIGKSKPMNRLLQGDVGSGKTIVAALSALMAAESGHQTAFMAPTEILVRQHFETMQKFLKNVPGDEKPTIGIVTANEATALYSDGLEAKMSKKEFLAKTTAGSIAIVFGTHSLIQKSVSFKDLGLVVIDEQHRFGTSQRRTLARGNADLVPHFLSMSATPIPRTLMLTIFGDLDLSLITELPAGRKPITTKIVGPTERQSAYAFMRSEIKSGRQAFVICPRIDPDDETAKADRKIVSTLELRSVKEEYERLSKKIFPDVRVAMLHGQMKPQEKESVMREFKEGRSDILVATSVIEVGVDIPNATIMMIEGADRFGLAQLYQFRGRVGRGGHESYCLLMSESKGESVQGRLGAILKAKNGFELAEYDLKLRGPGEFFGGAQSGFPDTIMSGLQNPDLIKESREAAFALIKADPSLRGEPKLRSKLAEFEKRIHQE